MNTTEANEITAYLLTKKLPIDILLEVQDHFNSQITTLQRAEMLTFEEAFEKVKLTWRKELTLSWKGEMSLMDNTDLMRNISKQITITTLWQSGKMLLCYTVLILSFAQILSGIALRVFLSSALLLPLLYTMANYIYHFKDFKLARKYQNHVLTLHQHGILVFALTASNLFVLLPSSIREPERFFQWFTLQWDYTEIWSLLFTTIALFLLLGAVAYSIIAQRNYLRQIQRVKLFLKSHPLS